jgi:hypothetical protein
MTLLEAPHVETLARVLRECIARAKNVAESIEECDLLVTS